MQQELFRIFSKSSPTILNDEAINSIGILSHPEKYQSSRFKRWLELCKAKNRTDLEAEVIKFLQSKDSINSINELGKEWTEILIAFFKKGNGLTKENSLQIIKEHKVEALFAKNKEDFANKYMALADTMLGLLILKSLGSQSNIDYQAVLKVMSYIERCIDLKCKLPEIDNRRYFEKRILIPSCFSKYNPCDEPVPTDSRFPFLEKQVKNRKEEKISGCVAGADCSCKENEDCVKQSKCCVKPRIDKVELMVVKTETKCYKAGDISFIKNVLQGEKLSTKHSELTRTEELTETESDIKQFEERYLQTEDKTSLNNEVEDVLKKDSGFNAGLTTNFEYGVNVEAYNLKATGGAFANYSNNTSISNTRKAIQDYSKDIINRSTKQIEQKVRNLSSVKRIHETQEKNKHGFDNSAGTDNVNGQYLFVNKISKAQMYNWGKASVIDLILPEPAALYKKLFEKKFDKIIPIEPKMAINSPNKITPENYKDLATEYKLFDLPEPPKQIIQGSVHFDGGTGEPKHIIRKGSYVWSGSGREYNSSTVDVPDGYFIEGMYAQDFGSGSVLFNGHSIYGQLVVEINSSAISIDSDGNGNGSISNTHYEGSQTMNLTGVNVTWFKIDIKVNFQLKPEKMLKWQTEIFSIFSDTYEKKLEEYKKELKEYEDSKEEFEAKVEQEKKERYNKNPFILRELEKQELKRMAISYISCQFYDQFDAMKNKVEPCGYPEMNVKEAYEEGLFVQFFEQAFNWNLMTYIFYPYFWGKKCGWPKSVKEEATDLIFEKFLQAGSCHVQIPIRPSHHTLVQHFIDFGEVWQGAGEPPLPNDPYYVSIAQEIKEQFQNFNTEREGTIDVTKGDNFVILNGSDYYWNVSLLDNDSTNDVNINNDIDREILLDFVTYRIVAIEPNFPLTSTTHNSWKITLERKYEGNTATNLKWSTGAIYIGAPWEFVTPTNLVFLRNKSKCLPCYPLEECKEQ